MRAHIFESQNQPDRTKRSGSNPDRLFWVGGGFFFIRLSFFVPIGSFLFLREIPHLAGLLGPCMGGVVHPPLSGIYYPLGPDNIGGSV